MTRPVVISYGAGLDSWVMLLEAVRRGIRIDYVVFCDVGDFEGRDPGEWPSTIRHIREVVMPFCADNGIDFVWLHSRNYPIRRGTPGEARSLFAWLEQRGQIPVSGPGRICTIIAKVERFEAWLADTFSADQVVETWIGFEAGEEARAANDPNRGKGGNAQRANRFPLIEWQLCRCRCEAIAEASGLPVPRKSACTFCPYASRGDWQTLRQELPATFDRVAQLEARKLATPTKRGLRLSIMGYRKSAKHVGRKLSRESLGREPVRGEDYSAPTLEQFTDKAYKPARRACGVCGAKQRASKATGCSYLETTKGNAA